MSDNDLLADLNDLDSSESEAERIERESMSETMQLDPQSQLLASLQGQDDILQIAKLHKSKGFQDILCKIRPLLNTVKESTTSRIEQDPEYSLIVSANNFLSEIEDELAVIHKYVKDHYSSKFPELESLVPNPREYFELIQLIGNETDLNKVDLKSLLNSATVMVVLVASTTTTGNPLSDVELEKVLIGCALGLELDEAKSEIIRYVESRMTFFAPNLTVILGSFITAKLMGLAGGLTALSHIPSCNIMVLGNTKKTNLGLSSVSMQKHAGIVYLCDFIKSVPMDLKRKAARVVCAKVALASRVDCARESSDGSIGLEFRKEIMKRIEDMLSPPSGQHTKALPAPLESAPKRRGGRRARKAKERYQSTELQKQQNKLAFGVAEEEVGFGDETIGLGMLGKESGKIRIQHDDRHKIQLPKKYQKTWHSSQNNNVSGLASSVSFTPIKGIELENPELQKAKLQSVKDDDKYFSGSFFKKPLPKNS